MAVAHIVGHLTRGEQHRRHIDRAIVGGEGVDYHQ